LGRPVLRISRKFSQRSVIEAIVQNRAISRAAIAKQTGLSKQTISEIMRLLEQDGWVRETGRTRGHVGRSAVTYELVIDAAYVAAIDLGGTQVRLAIADLAGQIIVTDSALTGGRGGQELVDHIVDFTFATAARRKLPRKKIKLAVIGVPGVPDMETGRVMLAPNIAGFDEMDVREAFRQGFGTDVMLENDVNLAVLGESWLGRGQGVANLAYVALGTGIGSGLMVGGQLVKGAANAAGEMGFLPFGDDPFAPETQRMGAYESAVAANGIVRRYQALSNEKVSVPEVFERARGGDRQALAVIEETARFVALGIGAICAIANPGKVILGGSIGLQPEIRNRVEKLLPLCFPYPVPLEEGGLGTRATVVGAAAVGLSHLHNTLFGVDAPNSRISLPPATLGALKEAAE
jgi:predicted NBD/HSP70 family sugar kinase